MQRPDEISARYIREADPHGGLYDPNRRWRPRREPIPLALWLYAIVYAFAICIAVVEACGPIS